MTVYRPPIYFHTIRDAAGVVAANNFLSVFNPLGSGKSLVFLQAEIVVYAIGGTGGTESLVATRITSASGGSLVLASQVNRFLTGHPNPVAQVRTGNPSVTVDAAFPIDLNAWAPPQTTGQGGNIAFTTQAPGDGFICVPGQGIVFSTASGDTDQRWKINTIWAEAD